MGMRPPCGEEETGYQLSRQHSIHTPFEESMMHVGIMLIDAWSFFSSGKGTPFWCLRRGGVKL